MVLQVVASFLCESTTALLVVLGTEFSQFSLSFPMVEELFARSPDLLFERSPMKEGIVAVFANLVAPDTLAETRFK